MLLSGQLLKFIPLWRRRIPKYPLYVKGNPQLRITMPQFWMKMTKTEQKMPKNLFTFEVHPQMTRYDVQNYLEKIYGVSVVTVRTHLIQGEDIKVFGGANMGTEPDKRIAFVQFSEDTKFTLPELFGEKKTEQEKTVNDYKKIVKEFEGKRKKTWDQDDVPGWLQ